MKIRILLILILISIFFINLFPYDKRNTVIGFKVMAGGRYDDMRMCVGSDPGIKGGPIADVMFLVKKNIKPDIYLAFELPVMRPILFASAFKMLQFEPQVSIEFYKKMKNKSSLVFAPGMGISLHYGPDYKSDLDNRGKSFFAIGPLVSGLIGISSNGKNDKKRIIGIRLFYTSLFSGDTPLSPGTVFGGIIESHFQL